MKKANFIVTTKIIFKNQEGKYLLLKNKQADSSGSFFDLPGGTVERGEQLDTTITREMLEELKINLSIDDITLSGVHIVNNSIREYDLCIIAYTANNPINEFELSDEHEDYMFVDSKEIDIIDDGRHIIRILKDVI